MKWRPRSLASIFHFESVPKLRSDHDLSKSLETTSSSPSGVNSKQINRIKFDCYAQFDVLYAMP